MANKPTKAEYEGFKKALANPMTPQPIKDKLQSVIDQYASEYEGSTEKTEAKPKTTRGTKPATTRKASTTKPKKSVDDIEKAKAEIKRKTGKTEAECESIIEQYRALRAKAQQGKRKAEEASEGNKQRIKKLQDKGDLIEGTTEKTADAVIETAKQDVADKIEKEIEVIEDKAEKEAKAEVAKDKTLKTPQAKKDKVAEKVKEKVAQKTKPMVQRIVIDTSELLTAIATSLGKLDKDSKKEFLIKLRSDIDKLLSKFAFGGLTDGASQVMNVQQSNLSSSSVNPSHFANGGGVEKNYNNPEKSTHVLHIDGHNWYLEKIDSTHFYMSNSPNYRGMAHHIGQHKGESYYDEVREWLKSTYANGGVVGQEIVFDDSGEENTGVIKEITNMGDYIVKADDGRTLLAQRELDVISLGKMREKATEAPRKRFGFFEGGGVIEEGEMVFVIPENNLIAEGIRFNDEDDILVEFIGKRPSGGDKRGSYRLKDLKYAQYDWDKDKYYSKGGGVDSVSYDEVLDLLKEKLEDSVDDLPMHFEMSSEFKGEEVEHESRDGFIPYTDGGYQVRWFEYISMFYGAGYGLPTRALDNEKDRQIEYNFTYAKERFMDEYPEIVEELGEENIDYNSLNDAGYGDEAEQLSEWEMDFDGEDTIMCEIGAYYYSPNNDRGIDGKHTLRLFGLVNLESPYHRSGNLEDRYDIDITFDSIEDLEQKIDEGLEAIIRWFDGDFYNDSTEELRIRRMARGGKLWIDTKTKGGLKGVKPSRKNSFRREAQKRGITSGTLASRVLANPKKYKGINPKSAQLVKNMGVRKHGGSIGDILRNRRGQ